MKIIRANLNKYEKLHGMLVSRGAPRHLLRHKFTLERTDLTLSSHPHVQSISPMDQLATFAKTLSKPLDSPYWYAIGSNVEDTTGMLCALSLMTRGLNACVEVSGGPRPLLHRLVGGRYDRLRDDKDYLPRIGQVGMLILTNIATNSTLDKIEKCRDLLHQWSHIPRVVVIEGGDPLKFCLDVLFMAPTRVLYVKGNGRRSSQV